MTRASTAFFTREFLSPTMVFIHNRVRAVARHRPVEVFCARRLHRERFPLDPVTCIGGLSGPAERVRCAFHRRIGGRYPPLRRAALRELDRRLRDGGFGVVHACFGLDAVQILPVLRDLPIPLVVAFAGFDATRALADRAYRAALPELFERLDAAVVVCEHLGQKLEVEGLDGAKIRVIHDGIPIEEFPFTPPPAPDGGPVVFLHLSGFSRKKGVPRMIEAFHAAFGAGGTARLRIAGDGETGPEARALVRERSLADCVEFTGYVEPEDRAAFLRSGHVFLHPSRTDRHGDQEGVPNTLKEAMAIGLPVVASRHAGIPELVEDGRSGLLAREGDVAHLAECMVRIASAPADRAEMGAAGRRKVEEEYTLDGEVQRLLHLYDELA